MSTQPEALRLAEVSPYLEGGERGQWIIEAAAELRRLHAENEALQKALYVAVARTARRCMEMAMWPQGIDDEQAYYGRMFAEFIEREFKGEIARAAIKAVEGEKT